MTDDLADDMDIYRQCRLMYAQANMQAKCALCQ